MTRRADALASTLEQGANALAKLAATLTDAEWTTPVPRDGRTIGVIVHHVGNMYPIEIELAQAIAAGNAVTGVTWQAVHDINAAHARDNARVTREEAIAFLRRNSEAAATAVRALTDEQLDRATPNSLYFDTPLTCQFFLEDHAVRHSWYHAGRIREALAAEPVGAGA
ncbi:MAG TPA: DinB family protein [Gemmatimonadales bacterium]|nr:DinB family protein [Gemmatimonadales bacterium]